MAALTWANKLKITIDHTKVDGTLTDFPLPIAITDSCGSGDYDGTEVFDELTSDANRFKIAVTAADLETQYYVEIESWDDANEKAFLHVKVPSISATVDTVIYLWFDSSESANTTYVGDSGSTAAQSVWDSNFIGVWHMNQDPSGGAGCILDSTSNDNDGTPAGSMLTEDLVDADFGKAIDFEGTDDTISLADNASIDITGNITVEGSFNLDTLPGSAKYPQILGKQTDYTGYSLYVNGDSANILLFSTGHGGYTWDVSPSISVSIATWYHTAGVYDGSRLKLYSGGVEISSPGTAFSSGLPTNAASLDWSPHYSDPGTYGYLDGKIGETRISNIARTAAWCKATNSGFTDSLLAITSAGIESAAPVSCVGAIVTSDGQKVTSSAAPLSSIGVITAQGLKAEESAAPLSSIGAITISDGQKIGESEGPISSVGTITVADGQKSGESEAPLSSVATITTSGLKIEESTAPILSVGAITAAGLKIEESEGPLSSVATITTSNGEKIGKSAAPISSVGVITSVGQKSEESAAPLSSIGTITTSAGQKMTESEAPISSIGVITASGEKVTIGQSAAPLSSVGTITAAGQKSSESAAPLSSVGTIIAAGSKAGESSTPLSSVGTIISAGEKINESAAPISSIGIITVAGEKLSSSAAPISSVGVITNTGDKLASSAAPISAVGTITASGEKVTVEISSAAPLSSVGAITVNSKKLARASPPLSSVGIVTTVGEKVASSAALISAVGVITATGEKVVDLASGIATATFSLKKPTATFTLKKPTITFS